MIDTALKIDIPYTGNLYFSPYSPHVYWSKLTKDKLGYGPYYSKWTSETINTSRIVVGSIIVDDEQYVQKSSVSDCQGDDLSFFFNIPSQTLYVHFRHGLRVSSADISLQVSEGYTRFSARYFDDIEYPARISSAPTLEYEVDKFEAGKMSFTDQSVTLRNGDGGLDDFVQNPVPGAEASFVLYDTEEDDELEFFTGFVSGDESTYTETVINIDDKRRRENIKIPNTLFNTTDWPDLESKYDGDPIPEGYGDVTRIEAIPVNGKASSGNVKFKFATDATTITAVYTEDDDVWTDVTASVTNASASTGYFELPRTTGVSVNSSGAVLDCVVTGTLRNYDNPGDIIKDMNNRYLSVAYDSSNYNTTEWASENAKLADDMYLYMDKEKEFFKWIEKLQNGSDYWFVYTIQGDGKRTIRVNDPDRAVSKTINYYDIKDDDKSIERDFEEYSSSVTVKYAEDIEAESYSVIVNTDYEDTVLEKYRFNQDSEYETLLNNSADATFKAALIAEDQSEARPIITFKQHVTSLSDLDLKLYDVINVVTSKPAETYWRHVDDEVYHDYSAVDEIYYDYSATDEILWDIGSVETLSEGREYWGTLRCQVIGISFDPESLDYTITARERPESEVT